MSNESIVVITTAAVTILTLFLNSYFTNRKLISLREQDRLDRVADAEIRRQDKEEILRAGDDRKDEIIKETKQVKTVAVMSALKSEKAIQACNDVTNKFNATVEVASKALEKISDTTPMQVEVINTTAHPVPTTAQKP